MLSMKWNIIFYIYFSLYLFLNFVDKKHQTTIDCSSFCKGCLGTKPPVLKQKKKTQKNPKKNPL